MILQMLSLLIFIWNAISLFAHDYPTGWEGILFFILHILLVCACVWVYECISLLLDFISYFIYIWSMNLNKLLVFTCIYLCKFTLDILLLDNGKSYLILVCISHICRKIPNLILAQWIPSDARTSPGSWISKWIPISSTAPSTWLRNCRIYCCCHRLWCYQWLSDSETRALWSFRFIVRSSPSLTCFFVGFTSEL